MMFSDGMTHANWQKTSIGAWDSYQEDGIAGAVADQSSGSCPRDLEQTLLKEKLPSPSRRPTNAAAVYLRKVRDLLRKLKREGEWKKHLSELRQANARKPRLLEILHRLDGRPDC